MNKKCKITMFVTLLFMLAVSAIPAWADGILEAKYGKTITVSSETLYMVDCSAIFKANTKVLSVTSNKPEVVYPQKDQTDLATIPITGSNKKTYPCFAFNARKQGTAKLTIKTKTGGKSKTYKVTVKVVKYTKPFTYIKVGSKKIKFNGSNGYYTPTKSATKVKLTVKPKTGWKVISVKQLNKGDAKNIWKGSYAKVSLKQGAYNRYRVYLYNTKKNQVEAFDIWHPFED